MFRLILVTIYLVLYLVLSSPLMLISFIIKKINRSAGDRFALSIVNHGGFRMIQFFTGVKVKVIGRDRIPDGPVLYIGNHRSFYDVILSYQQVKGPTGYVAKKEILYAPLLNVWMLLLNCQFLDRKNPRSGMDMLLKSIDQIKSGISVCIFPEGTRNKNPQSDDLLPFHAGSFKVATKTGAPIVPITINNTSTIWEDHFPIMKAQNVVIEYGEPIYTKDMTKEEIKSIHEKVHGIIQETYIKNKAEYADFISKKKDKK